MYVRSTLDHCSSIWSPFSKRDNDMIERVQRLFTRRALARCGQPGLSYSQRLLKTGLQTLESRRVSTDVCLAHQILKGFSNLQSSQFFKVKPIHNTVTRGQSGSNSLSLLPPSFKTKRHDNTFYSRVAKHWNRQELNPEN